MVFISITISLEIHHTKYMHAAMSACLLADAALKAECLFIYLWRERCALYTIHCLTDGANQFIKSIPGTAVKNFNINFGSFILAEEIKCLCVICKLFTLLTSETKQRDRETDVRNWRGGQGKGWGQTSANNFSPNRYSTFLKDSFWVLFRA